MKAEVFLTIDGEVASDVASCALVIDEDGHFGFDHEVNLTATLQGAAVLSLYIDGTLIATTEIDSVCKGNTVTINDASLERRSDEIRSDKSEA